MLNHVILVGRLVKTPELQLTESGKKVASVTLAVSRAYKNINGEYDTDFLDCTLWTGIAENTAEYCKTGDIIGVKGRLQTRIIEKDDGTKYKKVDVIAEKVTFLSSAKNSKNVDTLENSNECDESLKEVVNEVSNPGKKKKN